MWFLASGLCSTTFRELLGCEAKAPRSPAVTARPDRMHASDHYPNVDQLGRQTPAAGWASRLLRHHLRECGDDPLRRWLPIAVVAGDFNGPKKSARDKNPTADKAFAFRTGIGGYRPRSGPDNRSKERTCFREWVAASPPKPQRHTRQRFCSARSQVPKRFSGNCNSPARAGRGEPPGEPGCWESGLSGEGWAGHDGGFESVAGSGAAGAAGAHAGQWHAAHEVSGSGTGLG